MIASRSAFCRSSGGLLARTSSSGSSWRGRGWPRPHHPPLPESERHGPRAAAVPSSGRSSVAPKVRRSSPHRASSRASSCLCWLGLRRARS
eukprot:scaffold115156_cov24-Tisochrysis_lutea.AAC.1